MSARLQRAAPDTAIEVSGLCKSFGDAAAVLDLSVSAAVGEILVLLGPSGCGKTTTMRAIAGLETPNDGIIRIGERVVFDRKRAINVAANRRNVGMVFQSYAIWPHLTVFENVAFPLKMRKVGKSGIRSRVLDMLGILGIEELADRGASRLSGGQMQRVALARSLVMEPAVLLLDEPLSNLDAKLRERLRFELRRIQRQLGITMVYVTHDQAEALALADRVAVMRAGAIVQLDDAITLYERPLSKFVAEFLGDSNLYRATVVGSNAHQSRLRLSESDIELEAMSTDAEPKRLSTVESQQLWVSIRPEHVTLATTGETVNVLPATVEIALFMGNYMSYELAIGSSLPLRMVSSHDALKLGVGETVSVQISADRIRLLTE